MDRHHFLAAIGAVNFVKAFARHLERLGGGGFLERQRMLAIRVDHVHGRAVVFGRAQLDVRIDRDVGGPVLLAAQIAGGFFDKRNEGSVQRQIVRRRCRRWR